MHAGGYQVDWAPGGVYGNVGPRHAPEAEAASPLYHIPSVLTPECSQARCLLLLLPRHGKHQRPE